MIDTIRNIDRPGNAFAKGTYAETRTYSNGFALSDFELPKAGVSAEAGLGHVGAEWSIFDAEAKGPNAEAGAEISLASLGAQAYARANLASASASAGPLKAKARVGAHAGVTCSGAGEKVLKATIIQ